MSNTCTPLPADLSDGIRLSQEVGRAYGEELMGEYCFAEPFPHIVIDNFLPEAFAEKLLAHFPTSKTEDEKTYEKGYGGMHKRQISPYACDEYMREAFAFFNSAPMLQFLEGITTIPGLLPDPYFAGGGLHETMPGGLLGIHADFRVNESLQLLRRVNMLIYLNKDWQDSYGGHLELWDRQMKQKVKSVAPVFNRCVIFNTDSDSFHGHPDPLTAPSGVSRKSIALYYYTAQPIANDSGESRHTLYVARPNDTPQNIADAKKLERKRVKRAKKMFKKRDTSNGLLARLKQQLLKLFG